MKEKIVMCWSGGKDSAMALYELLKSDQYEVIALLTTVTKDYNRISMHGVRRSLLDQQAKSMGLPLVTVEITAGANNAEYETKMKEALLKFKNEGCLQVAFGDLFLEDLKIYREKNLALVGMTAVFPIWKKDTAQLIRDFIHQGFRAVLCCIDPRKLSPSFAGREINESLLNDLPSNVDPCGENGEYHSFVFKGPIFKNPIQIQIGEKVERDSFWFCELQ